MKSYTMKLSNLDSSKILRLPKFTISFAPLSLSQSSSSKTIMFGFMSRCAQVGPSCEPHRMVNISAGFLLMQLSLNPCLFLFLIILSSFSVLVLSLASILLSSFLVLGVILSTCHLSVLSLVICLSQEKYPLFSAHHPQLFRCCFPYIGPFGSQFVLFSIHFFILLIFLARRCPAACFVPDLPVSLLIPSMRVGAVCCVLCFPFHQHCTE